MSDDELQTRVDELLDLLKHQEQMEMEEAAEELGVDLDVVQNWVDFLVEERMVGIEYKFTKPYIYLNEPDEGEDESDEAENFDELKQEYLEQAEEKEIPEENRKNLWKDHVETALEKKKDFFMDEVDKRGLDNPSQLWEEYKQKLL